MRNCWLSVRFSDLRLAYDNFTYVVNLRLNSGHSYLWHVSWIASIVERSVVRPIVRVTIFATFGEWHPWANYQVFQYCKHLKLVYKATVTWPIIRYLIHLQGELAAMSITFFNAVINAYCQRRDTSLKPQILYRKKTAYSLSNVV